VTIEPVGEDDLRDLLPLLRGYCDFYRVHPPDERLLGVSRALIANPDEGVQLIARDGGGEAIGFATIYWTWHTLIGARIGVMHDLFVKSGERGHGVGRALIEACRRRARERGVAGMSWETEPDNTIAQRLYDSLGAGRTEWIAYWLEAGS
jgi:ribosomal protein S18 acetylase RimI-like enzyme